MQVVVKKPHIKFNISVDGKITFGFLQKIADMVKNEYGNIEVKYDDNEQLTDCFNSDWYLETKKSMKPCDYIKIYRENRNWTQTELGIKLGGLSRQYISDMENGRRSISKVLAKKLSVLFEIPIQRFI